MENGAVNIDTLDFFSVFVYFFIFLYVGVFVIFPHISSFSMTIIYICINDQVPRSSFSWSQITISSILNTFIYKNYIR